MVASTATDEQLLMGYAACGAQELFAELYRRYGRHVRCFIYRYVRNHEMAKDVSQQAWLNVARQAGTFNGNSRAFSWLCAVGKNAAISYLRKSFHRRELQVSELLFRLTAGSYCEPSNEAAWREEYSAMLSAVANLNQKLSSVVELVDIDELDYEIAASELGIPIGTVRSRRHRAIKMLRKTMAA